MAVREITIGKAREVMSTQAAFKRLTAGQPNDLAEVVRALESGAETVARAHKKYGSATIFRLEDLPRVTGHIEYPLILADADCVEMSVDELLDEVELVLEMSDRANEDYPLLYSLQVISPAPWDWPSLGPTPAALEQNPGRRAELETGYFYHEVLYRLSADDRLSLLRQFLTEVELVEVVVRTQDGPLTTQVRLSN